LDIRQKLSEAFSMDMMRTNLGFDEQTAIGALVSAVNE
jgi:hypothetical protein